ncbi:MAG: hypothetical protein NZ526_07860, partial [Aquificaceae bacterium]|nr:hypothetical protein [Aquificaceae bacterium]
REEAKAIIKAILEASRWLDDLKNRKEAAKILATKYIGVKPEDIEDRLLGDYELGKGLGKHKYTDDYMLFYKNGEVNLPKHSWGIFFMAQYRRWGMIKQIPNSIKHNFMQEAQEGFQTTHSTLIRLSKNLSRAIHMPL